jgi:hypothetical protein
VAMFRLGQRPSKILHINSSLEYWEQEQWAAQVEAVEQE